jgi:peptide chain release factor 3
VLQNPLLAPLVPPVPLDEAPPEEEPPLADDPPLVEELVDDVESTLGIPAAPVNWPVGNAEHFRGVYDLQRKHLLLYEREMQGQYRAPVDVSDLDDPHARALIGENTYVHFRESLDVIRIAGTTFDLDAYRAGTQTPVFFGSAMTNFGLEPFLRTLVELAPHPHPRPSDTGIVEPTDERFTGFVFKIQANMDPQHRDRIAFMRLCSGKFNRGMRMYHVRLAKEMRIADALTFMAADRQAADEAFAGDIIGLHNHGTINIGDTFTEGEKLTFTGIPNFAPEMFRRAVLKDPLKTKQLAKGLDQLCEEGATQLFRPLRNNDLILGAVGQLQFEVVAFRLQDEYAVSAVFDNIAVHTARWVYCDDEKHLEEFRTKAHDNLALDHAGALAVVQGAAT